MTKHFNTNEKNCYDYGCTDDCPAKLTKQVRRARSESKDALKTLGLLMGALVFAFGVPLIAIGLTASDPPVKTPARVFMQPNAESITFDMGGDAHVFHLDAFECHAHGKDIVCEYTD